MMTPKERAAMQQALEALEGVDREFGSNHAEEQAIAALREALAGVNMSPTEQAEQEAVGHLCEASFGRGQVFWFNKPADNTPLYAAPVRTKDLTDAEIEHLIIDQLGSWNLKDMVRDFARAVIAKDREKNK